MCLNKNIIVIVNAYSTSRLMPYHFIANGYQCIHVSTPLDVAPVMKKYLEVEDSLYLENIVMKEDGIEEVIKHLKKYNIKAILPGAESSVMIADQIASYFDVPKNNFHTTLVRRHKFYMIEQLKDMVCKFNKQYLATNLEGLLAWYNAQEFKKIVLKPALSTGSDNVYICATQSTICEGFNKIFQSANVYGFTNTEVVVQEFIDGTEYVVNSVSREGNHFITDCWQGNVTYNGGLLEDDYADKINPSEELICYTKKVLDALEITNGPAHTEIRLNEKGFYLIESGARLSGAIDPSAMSEAQGHNQLSCFAESIMDPKQFFARKSVSFQTRTLCVFYSATTWNFAVSA